MGIIQTQTYAAIKLNPRAHLSRGSARKPHVSEFQNLEQRVKQRALTTTFHRIVLTIEKINPVVSDFTLI